MLSWTWEWCLPDLICFGLTVCIVGWILWVLGEQNGWQHGFLDGCDLRDEESEKALLSEREKAKSLLKRLENVNVRKTDERSSEGS